MDPKKVQEIIREGKSHIDFCIELYRMQMSEGRFFLHEHPLSAWSWKLSSVRELRENPDVYRIRGDMCRFNMIINDAQGPALAYKPTGWMSNSMHILSELNKLCTNSDSKNPPHRHADLQSGRAAQAAVYPEKLCLSILKGLRKELTSSKVMYTGEIGTVCEDHDEKELFEEVARKY